MNVLVYAGPGTTSECVKHCLHTLRRFLSPHYAVISVDAKILRNEPWPEKTSLLVFPGGADLPYCREFNSAGNRKIKKFLNSGGKYIGFCAGGYYGASRLEFEVGTDLEVSGSRELRLFPGIARGCVYKGFNYLNNDGEKAVRLSIEIKDDEDADNKKNDNKFYSYYHGGPCFVNAQNFDNVEILAKYDQPTDLDNRKNESVDSAIVYCKVGDGAAILFGPHVEFDLNLLKYTIPKKDETLLRNLDSTSKTRDYFLELCFKKLNLKVNNLDELNVPKLTPLLLSSFDSDAVNSIVDSLKENVGISDDNLLKGFQDTFRLREIDSSKTEQQRFNPTEDYFEDPVTVVKDLWAFTNGARPSIKLTPYFNNIGFYSELMKCWNNQANKFHYGKCLLYGEILTSTNSLLEQNTNILRCLPTGFTAIGTTQISGRGRGGNVWVSPMGTLAVSIVSRMSSNSFAPIVFSQYVTALAMVDAVKNYGDNENSEAYSEMPIRLKWPNDIYLMKPEYIKCKLFEDLSDNQIRKYVSEIDPIYTKIGGILVSTVIQEKQYVMVIGTGINVSNADPTASLNSALAEINKLRISRGKQPLENYSIEKLAAKFVHYMEVYLNTFEKQGFQPLQAKYYKYWLHTDQIVILGSMSNTKAKIIGITENNGFLKVEEVNRQNAPTGNFFELQPDGNSFNMFKGLITKKA